MKTERLPDGGMRLELGREDVRLLRFLAERASFIDTPPDEQERILRMCDEILSITEPRSGE